MSEIIKKGEIKKGSVVVNTFIYNNCYRNGFGYYKSMCELIFDNNSSLKYDCDDVEELEDEHKGVYELLEDGTYLLVEDWED